MLPGLQGRSFFDQIVLSGLQCRSLFDLKVPPSVLGGLRSCLARGPHHDGERWVLMCVRAGSPTTRTGRGRMRIWPRGSSSTTKRFVCTNPRVWYSILIGHREAVGTLGFDGCSHLGRRNMSTSTMAWALADTVVGCTDISQSCDFGCVMANLGGTRHVCASVGDGEVEEFLEFLVRR